jgi:hypothetical protein
MMNVEMNCRSVSIPTFLQTSLVAMFFGNPKTFSLSGCSACACLFIDPLPGPAEIAGFYPAQYWWKASSGILKSLEGAYRKMALRDHRIHRAAG